MKGMFKILLYSAPILGLVLVLVWGQVEKHDAQMEAEKAQFDQQFAHDNDEFDKSFQAAEERVRHTGKAAQKAEASKAKDKDTFWTDQRKEAEQRLAEAQKRVAAARGKVDAATKAADQALQEIEKDAPQATTQNQNSK